eukprot:Em0003g460a
MPRELWLAAGFLSACCGVLYTLINAAQPSPYMDEVFHVPQAQRYCSYDFSHWDLMITTPPGLYLTSVAVLAPASWILGIELEALCSVSLLRAQNVLISVAIFPLLYFLLLRIHGSTSTTTWAAVHSALNMALFPVSFFFSFLYYTDIGSTFLVLLGYALGLSGHTLLSAVVLTWSLWFRQTNIIWVAFVAGVIGLQWVEREREREREGKQMTKWAFLLGVVRDVPTLLRMLWPHVCSILLFLLFIVWNGSVALGDKTHHQAGLHLPQLFYFFAFTCGFAATAMLSQIELIASFLKRFRDVNWIASFCILMIASLLAVHYFTYAHPYLLADNRHYPFYVWKNVFQRHWIIKYLYLPPYSLCVLAVVHVLLKIQTALWVLLYLFCVILVLVPQKLLEFRYFVFPYLLFRLHVPQPSWWGLVGESVLHVAVTMVTVVLFVNYPFRWPGNDSLQRFMW